MFIALDWWH
ncbi:hypothetical protein Pint_27401 [Pistacia integerrima]|uniref:Uncharacterized protein n=1 Tax=Pistacia integerrima TaxID=434235 RepID=A0ACC0YSD0_9ROSI|nr:hypothetical protein Pint_27401 [Pistacia integerrima]